MTDRPIEERVSLLESENAALKKTVGELEHDIDAMQEETQKREKSQMRWALYFLGGIVAAMGTWIWSQIEPLVSLRLGK